MTKIRGLLFDKDGTLLDFQATWGSWASDVMLELAEGDAALANLLAERILLDRETRTFSSESPVISGTNHETAAALQQELPGLTLDDVIHRLDKSGIPLTPVPIVPLGPLLRDLRAASYVTGVATNDSSAPTLVQLELMGLAEAFDFVVCADSGHGAKPAPGMCLAFLEATGLAAEETLMIGDSLHDLHAGRAAGMQTLAVLSGPIGGDILAPHADFVLPDIGHLSTILTS